MLQILRSCGVRLVYTVALFLNTFAFGLNVNIFSACLLDLQHLYGVDQKTLMVISLTITAGSMLGALSGMAYGRINRHLTMSIFSLILAITTALTPFCSTLYTVFVCLFVNGISIGVYSSSYQTWFTQMWPHRVNAVMQVNQCIQGLGAILAPTIAASFVLGNARDVTTEERRHAMVVPFGVAGVIQGLSALILLVIYLVKPYKHRPSFVQRFSEEHADTEQICLDDLNCDITPQAQSSWFNRRFTMLTLCCLFLPTYLSAEDGYTEYSTEMWQHQPIRLSGEVANRVFTVFQASVVLGTLLTTVASLYLSSRCIIGYHYKILLIGSGIFFFGKNNLYLVYLGSFFTGYGFSAMEGAIMTLVEENFTLTDRTNAIFQFMARFGQASFTLILYYYPIDQGYANVVLSLVGIYARISWIFFTIIRWIIYKEFF